MTRVQAYLYLLVAAAIIIGSFALFTQRPLYLHPNASQPNVDENAPIPQPPYTKEVETQLAVSRGFQVLVSYTYRGFEPAAVSIPAGDTIRFTNNTHDDLWVASNGSAIYPGGGNTCGASAFDSCKVLKPGEFWEFTFTQKGTWSYANNLEKTNTATITVQ